MKSNWKLLNITIGTKSKTTKYLKKIYTKIIKRNLKLITLISNISLVLDCTQSNLNVEPSFAGFHGILRVIWLVEHKFQARNFGQL